MSRSAPGHPARAVGLKDEDRRAPGRSPAGGLSPSDPPLEGERIVKPGSSVRSSALPAVLAVLAILMGALSAPVRLDGQVVEAPTDPGVLPALLPPWIRGLRDDVESILPRDRWPTARWSLLAVSLERGDTLVSADPDALLAPASNVKLLTSAAAMDALDPDFHYTTYLLADGDIAEGVLHGDLVLYGTGDPTLSEAEEGIRPAPFQEMARTLKALGIRRVNGDLVGDASLFRGPSRAPGWNPNDFNDSFAAPAAALAFTENLFVVEVAPGRSPGDRPRVRLLPEGATAEVVNEVRTVSGAPRRGIQLIRRSPGDPIRVVGEIRTGSPQVRRAITVEDPVLHAASGLRAALEREGIAVVGHTRVVLDPEASVLTGGRTWAPAFGRPAPKVLAAWRSPPLREILTVVNQRSHNLYADMVSFTLGHVLGGDGSFEGGARATAGFLERSGVPAEQVVLIDGSGLSRNNRATAGTFIRVLQEMSRGPYWADYLETLPEAGGRSLRRMGRSAAEGNLRAKTGTIRAVSALSGIVRASDGEAVLFSILANDVPNTWQAKDLEDRIGIRLAGALRPAPVAPVLDSLVVEGVPGPGDRPTRR
jgi:serine-type D-Ala-D-Ala carboxypeptidase/endopeptidase (penicillin-binding protein 4)